MNGQGGFAATLTGRAPEAGEIALSWLSSPSAWSQVGLLAVAYLVARLAAARVTPIINRVPEIIETAVAALPFALKEPDGPDCELRGFGGSSVDFAAEYWVAGIDGGKNTHASQVNFAIWNALKAAGIEMSYPHRVIEMKGGSLG